MENFEVVAGKLLEKIIGKECCYLEVGEYRSLSLGFGMRVETQGLRGRRVRSEWNIGTYNSAWRVVSHGEILCGSMTPVDDNAEHNALLESIQFGAFVGLELLSPFDIRLKTSNGVDVEFMSASSRDEEDFHIIGVDHSVLTYHYKTGWKLVNGLIPTGGSSTI
jgi:hypothetical protein